MWGGPNDFFLKWGGRDPPPSYIVATPMGKSRVSLFFNISCLQHNKTVTIKSHRSIMKSREWWRWYKTLQARTYLPYSTFNTKDAQERHTTSQTSPHAHLLLVANWYMSVQKARLKNSFSGLSHTCCVKLDLHMTNNKTWEKNALQLPVVWSIKTFICFHQFNEGLPQLAHSLHLLVDKQPLANDPLTE